MVLLDASAIARNVGRDLVCAAARCAACSHSDLRCADGAPDALPAAAERAPGDVCGYSTQSGNHGGNPPIRLTKKPLSRTHHCDGPAHTRTPERERERALVRVCRPLDNNDGVDDNVLHDRRFTSLRASMAP
jgi:hypothetical protein